MDEDKITCAEYRYLCIKEFSQRIKIEFMEKIFAAQENGDQEAIDFWQEAIDIVNKNVKE